MVFNTHERTPKIKTNKPLKIMLAVCYGFTGAFFLFTAIATSIMSQSIAPIFLILVPLLSIAAIAIITQVDMEKAYVEIEGDRIRVVDYYCFRRKERTVFMHEIKNVKIVHGNSFAIRGYRFGGHIAAFYIVFRDENNKYLFKVLNCPETNEYFSKQFEIQ